MSEEQADKLKLKTTDTNRFKIEAEQPTEQPADKLPKADDTPTKIDDLNEQRKVNTGSFKRIDVTGQAPASTTAMPGMGEGGMKKSETVRLKVVRATPAGGAPTAGPAASTVKLNLKRPDAPVATPAAPADSTVTSAPAQGSTLKLHPTTPQAAETSAANAPTTKVPLSTPPAPATQPKLSIKKEEAPAPAPAAPAEPKADATTAVPPPAEPAKPALKLNKPKKEAAATVAVEPPAPEAAPAEEKKEEAKPAMKMKGATKEDDDVAKYLPQQDDDEPGALEGVAAVVAFLATGFATYQLVMNFLQQIQ